MLKKHKPFHRRIFLSIIVILMLVILIGDRAQQYKDHEVVWRALKQSNNEIGNSYYRSLDNYILCTRINYPFGVPFLPRIDILGESLILYDVNEDKEYLVHKLQSPTSYWMEGYSFGRNCIVAIGGFSGGGLPEDELIIREDGIYKNVLPESDYYAVIGHNILFTSYAGADSDEIVSYDIELKDQAIILNNCGVIDYFIVSDKGVLAYNDQNGTIFYISLETKDKIEYKLKDHEIPLVLTEKEEGVAIAVLLDGRVIEYDLLHSKSEQIARVSAFYDTPDLIRTLHIDGNELWLNDGGGNIIRVNLETREQQKIITQSVETKELEEYIVNYCKSFIVIDITYSGSSKKYLDVYNYKGKRIRKKHL